MQETRREINVWNWEALQTEKHQGGSDPDTSKYGIAYINWVRIYLKYTTDWK